EELEREAMKAAKSTRSAKSEHSKIREGYRMVTPYLVVSDVHQEIDFLKKVFDAEGKVYGLGSKGGFHSEYRIGDSMLMIGGGGKGSQWKGESVPAALHVYVQDVDGTYQRAIDAGAKSLMPATVMEYGERSPPIEDAGSNSCYMITAFTPPILHAGM